MKKNTLSIIAILGLTTLLVASPVSAAPSAAMSATIPFEFTVGKTVLPAGQYEVKTNFVSSGVLLIQGRDGGPSVMILTNTTYTKHSMNETSLVFNRYGSQYFLSKIWTAGEEEGCELHKTPAEREISRAYRLAKSNAPVETVTIAADRH